MNNDELREVQSAIDQTHDATTSQSKRTELYGFLESKTSDRFKCKQMGYHFISSNEDHYQLFGYHCIRKYIKYWDSLNKSERNDLKQLALNLFKFSIRNNESTNITLLKEKISELIVTLATHTWPHQWHNLLRDLFSISQQNPMSLEMLFIILKDLYFIVGDRQIIPEKRKKQIKNALMKNSKEIMQICALTLSNCFEQIFASSSATSNTLKIAQNILRRCLEALPKYLNQFPLKIIIDSQVLIGLAKVLQSAAATSNDNNAPRCYDEFYRFALLSILYFFMRKFNELNTYSKDERIKQQHTILIVWNIEMETTKSLYTMSDRNNNNVALNRLDNMMESMMRRLKLFHGLLTKPVDANDVALRDSIRDIFLGISECTMKSSNLNIRLRSMSIWSFILNEIDIMELIGYDCNKHPYAQSGPFVNVVIGIMKYVLNHFRVKFHDLASFETEHEWQTSRNTLKAKISHLLRQCFVLCPLKGMECIGQFTLSILNCDKDTVNVNSVGHSNINNERYIALDGLCHVYRIIFENSIHYSNYKNKKKPKKEMELQIDDTLFDNNSPLLQMIEQMHCILLNWTHNIVDNSNDTQLMSRIYHLLSFLTPLYCRKHKYVQITFEKLLGDFPKPLPLNPTAADAFDIKCNAVANKRKIAHALLRIAKRIPHICVLYIDVIWKQVMDIIKSNFSTFKPIKIKKNKNNYNNNGNGVILAPIMDISEGPICHLFELLVCISNGLNDTKKKSQILSELLCDVIKNFNSSEIQNVLNDSKQFSRMMQFPVQVMSDSEYVDDRIRFAYHIRTLLNIIQSTLTASLLCGGQTGLKDLFHAAQLDTNAKKDMMTSFPLFSAVFPNVLKLNKLLSFMYTSEFKLLLTPHYHSMIECLNVKSLYNLYGLKHDELIRNPSKKPKEIIPLEKAVIWIQNVRDYICRIIAVSSYFDAHFFEHQSAMDMMIESIISYWDKVPLSHLAIIIKHFFMNFVQLCSPSYYPNIVPFLHQFLSQCFKKLNRCWGQQVNAFATATSIKREGLGIGTRQNSSGLRNECFHEFALRDASQKLWTAMVTMTINPNERGFILLHEQKLNKNMNKKKIVHVKSEGNGNNDFIRNNFGDNIMDKYQVQMDDMDGIKIKKEDIEGYDADIIRLKQDTLVMLMLQNENLCKCLLNGIESSLNWLDNSCHVRISHVASKIVSFIAKYKMKHLYVYCGAIFKSTLNALSRNKIGDNQANAELNVLCVTICQLLGPLCSHIIIQILQNVPNIIMDDANAIMNLITCDDPHRHTNAAYRSSIKAFTKKYVIGKQNVLSVDIMIKKEPV